MWQPHGQMRSRSFHTHMVVANYLSGFACKGWVGLHNKKRVCFTKHSFMKLAGSNLMCSGFHSQAIMQKIMEQYLKQF